MQLVYLIGIFEDNHNIVCDSFKTDSVHVMKNRLPVAKKHKEIPVYINLAQSHQQTMEIDTRNNNTQNLCKPYWFTKNWSPTLGKLLVYKKVLG